MKKIDAKKVISENARKVCVVWGLNTVTLGSRSGTSQTTARRLLKGGDERQWPRIDSIQQVADSVGVELWQMFFDGMPIELLGDDSLSDMIKTFAQCSDKNRAEIIDQISKMFFFKKYLGTSQTTFLMFLKPN